MGCLKLTYQEREGLEKSIVFLGGSLRKKEQSEKKCDSYSPFGLTFNSFKRSAGKENKFLFHNQTEFIDDLGLNWYQFKYRNHDPSIGRFFNIDPLADVYVYNSPYAFAENKLGLGSEFEGSEINLHPWLIGGSTAVAIALDKKMTEVGMKKTEKSVASKNLLQMYKLQKSGNKGKAENFAKNSGLGGLHNGKGDAFRHSLFNALNTQTVGSKLTKELGDAHEEDRPGQPDSEKKMDLNNNEVGRGVAEDNLGGSILELATDILNKMEDGEMMTIDSKGNVTKTELSKEQKTTILENLKKLDKNGEKKKK